MPSIPYVKCDTCGKTLSRNDATRCVECRSNPFKKCTDCGKPIGRYAKRCQECYHANRRAQTAALPKVKTCNICGQELPATTEYFYPSKTARFGVGIVCKSCSVKQSTQWGKDNRGRQRKTYNQWYAENAERQRELQRNRYHADIENSRLKSRKRVQKRRAVAHNADGTYTPEQIQEQYDRQNGRCYYAACGHAKLGDNYHIEHVIPLSRGGSNDISNIVLTCPRCNLSKNDKLPHEWPEGGRLL